jgi:hypothetical protein
MHAASSDSNNGGAGVVMLCEDSCNSLVYWDCRRRHHVDTIAAGKGYIDFGETLKACRTGAEANLSVNTGLANCRSTIQSHGNNLYVNFFAKYKYLQYLWRFSARYPCWRRRASHGNLQGGGPVWWVLPYKETLLKWYRKFSLGVIYQGVGSSKHCGRTGYSEKLAWLSEGGYDISI